MRVLRRPGWILGALAVIAFSLACFTLLAPWQLGAAVKSDERRELVESARQSPPVALAELQSVDAALSPDAEWREVTVIGRYATDEDLPLRQRSADPARATEILTPFQLAGSGEYILVNRGWTDAGIPAAPAGEVVLTARLKAAETTNQYKEPRVDDGQLVAYAIDPVRLGEESGRTYAPFSLQLSAGQPGSLGEIPLPRPVDGPPHFSYGIQWIVFGILAPLAFVAFAWRRSREPIEDESADRREPVASIV